MSASQVLKYNRNHVLHNSIAILKSTA